MQQASLLKPMAQQCIHQLLSFSFNKYMKHKECDVKFSINDVNEVQEADVLHGDTVNVSRHTAIYLSLSIY